jgi:hypothetical protein
MVVASLALFVALDGPATAAHFINGTSIKPNSITNKQVKNGTLGVQDLSKAAVRTLRTTPAQSVGDVQLRDKAVGAAKLAPGAVGNTQLAPAAVDAGKLADGSVGGNQLAAGAVTASKIADGSVGSGAIADGSLTTRDVGDFYGSVLVPSISFAANECKVVQVNAQAAAPGQNIADDIVVASPTTTGWPDAVIVTANPGAGNTVRIVMCRIGGDANPLVAPATTFYYVGFDTP